MKVTNRTRHLLEIRRENRDMPKKGYLKLEEIDWRINRGDLLGYQVSEIIIGANGSSAWYKVEDTLK